MEPSVLATFWRFFRSLGDAFGWPAPLVFWILVSEHRMKHSRACPVVGLLVLVGLGVVSCGSASSGPDASGGAATLPATGGAPGTALSVGGTEASSPAGASPGGGPMIGMPGGASGLGAGGINSGSSGGRSGNAGAGGHLGGGGSVVGNASGGGAAIGGITTPPGYKLVWHDEFDVDGPPNPSDYTFEKGFQRNEEAQWYQSANAIVQNGLLLIEARKETVQNPNYTGSGDWKTTRKTAEYTSASLSTSGHQSFQYGHFEMRARIPTEAGMWPAWWTLGVSGEWPSNGEIDIMEFYQSKLLANVACGTDTRWQAKWDSSAK